MALGSLLKRRATGDGRATGGMLFPALVDRLARRGATWIVPSILAACATAARSAPTRELSVWSFGAEGEAVAPMVRDFERANPDIHVRVQQIPWTAAHEKLLTAFVGGALPDVAQLGNTWILEFAALRALAPLDSVLSRDSTLMPRDDYFPGVLATNVVDDTLYGVPWYVDTRVMFYRADLLRRAGVARAHNLGGMARCAHPGQAHTTRRKLSNADAVGRVGAAGDPGAAERRTATRGSWNARLLS